MDCIPMTQFHRNLNVHSNLFFRLNCVGSRDFSCVLSKRQFMQFYCVLQSSVLHLQTCEIPVFFFFIFLCFSTLQSKEALTEGVSLRR